LVSVFDEKEALRQTNLEDKKEVVISRDLEVRVKGDCAMVDSLRIVVQATSP
jgi:hypothetical protein